MHLRYMFLRYSIYIKMHNSRSRETIYQEDFNGFKLLSSCTIQWYIKVHHTWSRKKITGGGLGGGVASTPPLGAYVSRFSLGIVGLIISCLSSRKVKYQQYVVKLPPEWNALCTFILREFRAKITKYGNQNQSILLQYMHKVVEKGAWMSLLSSQVCCLMWQL